MCVCVCVVCGVCVCVSVCVCVCVWCVCVCVCGVCVCECVCVCVCVCVVCVCLGWRGVNTRFRNIILEFVIKKPFIHESPTGGPLGCTTRTATTFVNLYNTTVITQ